MIWFVEYKTEIENPEYRYGDLNRPSRIEISGAGYIAQWMNGEYALVIDDKTEKVHTVQLKNIKVGLLDSFGMRVNSK